MSPLGCWIEFDEILKGAHRDVWDEQHFLPCLQETRILSMAVKGS